MFKRHLYHVAGLTDLDKIREQAAASDVSVVIHLHPHSEYCNTYEDGKHEVYDKEGLNG